MAHLRPSLLCRSNQISRQRQFGCSLMVRFLRELTVNVREVTCILCIIRAGQPRTGDTPYADLVEAIVGGDNIFRGEFVLLRA